MAAHPMTTAEVLGLRKALSTIADRIDRISQLMGRPIRSPKVLREWHDLLLFLLAHPHDAQEHHHASVELERVAVLAKHMAGSNERLRYALINSGVEGMPLQSTFSLRLTRWMLKRWGGRVELFLVEAGLDELRELMRLLLPGVEQETVDQPYADALQLITAVYGPSPRIQIQRLVEAVDALPGDERQRELIFSRLQVYVKSEGAEGCGMTFSRAPMGKVVVHPNGLQRAVDPVAVVNTPIAAPLKLSESLSSDLIDTARTVLATLHRETDPVTHPGAVELFDMGRGLRIALFHLDLEHRLPFDSYVGFMAFRNGVPLAYGGAWIFPGKSKVGINVFPALRGGESAWFFAQLLRLYRQRYGVGRFEAENYQLGHKNPDGLKSGAYWFYYRLGFRPATPGMRRRAEREFSKLAKKKGYLVPVSLLKELVEHGLELVISESRAPVIDTAALTMAVQRHVVECYNGDRQKALRAAIRRLERALPLGEMAGWTTIQRQALYLWALPLDMIPELEQWSLGERKRTVELIRSKAGETERQHQLLLSKHGPLLRAFANLAAG